VLVLYSFAIKYKHYDTELERHIHWRDIFTGETYSLERHVHWRDIFTGETYSLERHIHWRDIFSHKQ
jgi:hypothetical protein